MDSSPGNSYDNIIAAKMSAPVTGGGGILVLMGLLTHTHLDDQFFCHMPPLLQISNRTRALEPSGWLMK